MAATLKLNSGFEMPVVGLGTWRADPGVVGAAVKTAIKSGYRHIDGAMAYQNEPEIGLVLKELFEEGILKREELFYTSKLWNTCHRKADVRKACIQTLKDLGLDYLDLYLMHYPIAFKPTQIPVKDLLEKDQKGRVILDPISIRETWEAMEELVDDGLVRSIGISNFGMIETQDLLSYCRIPPANNQLELHVYFSRPSLVEFCQEAGISVCAHTPLGGGAANAKMLRSANPLDDAVVQEMAQKHGRTPAQVLLRYPIQLNIIVIPKSVKEARIKENFDVNFELDAKDMEALKKLNRGVTGRSLAIGKFWGWDPLE